MWSTAQRALPGVSIRLDDYGAPEIHHAHCGREYRIALNAKRELERLAPTLRLQQVACATRNYGRWCAHVDGLAEHMISMGLASPYDCTHRCPPHRDWCARADAD